MTQPEPEKQKRPKPDYKIAAKTGLTIWTPELETKILAGARAETSKKGRLTETRNWSRRIYVEVFKKGRLIETQNWSRR